jgi:hypothetical protein
MAQLHGKQIEVAAVVGDDLVDRLGELAAGRRVARQHGGRRSVHRDPRPDLVGQRVLRRLAVVEALRAGAQIVVTGRCTDTGLTLAPMIHAFDWEPHDWDRLAAGIVAGHIVECGAHAPAATSPTGAG